MDDIFIGLSARVPVLSVTQRANPSVFIIPVGESFASGPRAARRASGLRDFKIDRAMLIAQLHSAYLPIDPPR